MLVLKNNVMFSVVNYGQSEQFVKILRDCNASGATVISARGTASSAILRLLGIGDKSREIVLCYTDEATADEIVTTVRDSGKINGVCAIIGDGQDTMEQEWKMITIIVNSGYADDIMEIARCCGVTGGTIVHARGTVPKGQEERFLGITIVPEKEMIVILAPTDKVEGIVDSINQMECLQQPGIGVMCVQDVKKFVKLGKS